MTGGANIEFSRRVFLRDAVWAVPVAAAVLASPRALAAPARSGGCDDPDQVIDNCVVALPQEFSWTSFSTSPAVGGGTDYAIQFTTRITPGPPVPADATGYRIDSLRIAGTSPEGSAFSVAPSVGESGSRAI